MHRFVSNLTVEGKLELRMVQLAAESLEVYDRAGRQLAAIPRRRMTGVDVVGTGGAVWLEAIMDDGGRHRIAASTLSGAAEIGDFRERVSEWIHGPVNGVAEPSEEPDRHRRSKAMTWAGRLRVLAGLLRYALPYRGAIAVSVIVLTASAGLQIVPPYLMKFIIDGGVLASSEMHFVGLIGLLAAVHLLQAAIQVLRTSISIRVGNTIMSRIRRDMFDKLMKLSVQYYDKRKTAPFISRIQYDTSYVEGFLSEGIPAMLAQAVMTAAIVVLLFTLDWKIAALLLGLFPVAAIFMWKIWPKMRAMTVRIWNAEYGLQQYIAESLQGIRIIKAFHQESAERQRFDEWNDVAVKRATDQMIWSQWLNPALSLAVSLSIAFVWLVGGRQVIQGGTSLGTVIAFTSYLSMFLGQLRWTYRSAGWANKSIASADRILDLMTTAEEMHDTAEPVSLPRATGEIRVRSVSFAYEKGRDVLKDISLHIRPGEKVGVTGRSGAGKSTLIHLLCRFYDPDTGGISMDGIDLRRIPAADLRRNVGVVFQETFLFDGTIAQNIAYGRPDATPEAIIEAARSAHAHRFIAELPYGYDTRIGERGVRLSGGEKQRISIARTLLMNPPVLILDEATSSMDAETEREIQAALHNLCRGRTTVTIAHRLSTLQRADRIIVLDQGRIVEDGTHEELQRRQGIYHQLLKAGRFVPAPKEAAV